MTFKSLLVSSLILIPCASQAAHYVHGYYRSNGTYVSGHMSMDPYEARSTGYSYHHNQIVQNQYYNNNGAYDTRSALVGAEAGRESNPFNQFSNSLRRATV